MPDTRELVRRFIEDVYGQGRVELIDELIHEDYIEHPMPAGFSPDREGLKRFIHALHGALSDTNAQLERILVDDGQVAFRWRVTGTHTGEFLGIAPSHNHVETTGNDVAVVRDGQIEERWCEQDLLSLMSQLGAIDPSMSPT